MNKNSHNSQATRVHETMQQSDYKQQIKAKQRTFNVSASLHHENCRLTLHINLSTEKRPTEF